jgi:uncharacterized protein
MKVGHAEIEKLRMYFSKIPVKKAYLFGSMSREDASETSDLDILVEFESNTKLGLLGFSKYQLDLESLLHKKIDLVELSALSKYIVPFVEKDKVLIYEK